MNRNEIFQKLWSIYTEQNPHVKAVFDLFISNGEEIVNDHIAFRTFNDPRTNIDKMSAIFLEAGYVHKGSYNFGKKHLFARHFEVPGDSTAPRIFISELLTEEFSPELQKIVKAEIDAIPIEKLSNEGLAFSGRIWDQPSHETYELLRKESEYAAWVYVHGFTVNHFTVSINHLKNMGDIRKVNEALKDNGFKLNSSGGEIKGSAEELLEQSSTMAGKKEILFSEGKFEVPSCYYEFAQRYPDKFGKLYSGFIAESANKIFESTDYYTN